MKLLRLANRFCRLVYRILPRAAVNAMLAARWDGALDACSRSVSSAPIRSIFSPLAKAELTHVFHKLTAPSPPGRLLAVPFFIQKTASLSKLQRKLNFGPWTVTHSPVQVVLAVPEATTSAVKWSLLCGLPSASCSQTHTSEPTMNFSFTSIAHFSTNIRRTPTGFCSEDPVTDSTS